MALVKLYANLRKIAQQKELVIAGCSLDEILTELVRQIPALQTVLLEHGQIRPHVIIILNGHPTSDLQAMVADQDEIAVFPPIAGG